MAARTASSEQLVLPAAVAWSSLEGFDARDALKTSASDWKDADSLCASGRAVLDVLSRARRDLVQRWDEALHETGGDPSHQDWEHFRPLRLGREEDWSDWLAHLAESDPSGALAQFLFARSEWPDRLDLARIETVEREERSEDGSRRADLLLLWAAGGMTHIEVKVGDVNYEKTVETGEKLGAKYPDRPRSDILLIADWQSVDTDLSEELHVIRWSDVSVALRKALRRRATPVVWRAWASAFVGAIEQMLLGCPRADAAVDLPAISSVELHCKILEEALP